MISVMKNPKGKGLVVENNPTDYNFISKGCHGAVFKLSADRCVKIFLKNKSAAQEADAYTRIKGWTRCPKIYEVGPNYIVMEYIEGLTLEEYLKTKNYISESITKQILLILQEMKKLGFSRIDIRLHNAMVTKDDTIKVIDLVSEFHKKGSMAKRLFRGLEVLGLLDLFIAQVKEIDFKSYSEIKSLHEEFLNNRLL